MSTSSDKAQRLADRTALRATIREKKRKEAEEFKDEVRILWHPDILTSDVLFFRVTNIFVRSVTTRQSTRTNEPSSPTGHVQCT